MQFLKKKLTWHNYSKLQLFKTTLTAAIAVRPSPGNTANSELGALLTDI